MATRNVEYVHNNRTVAEVLNDFKSEIKDFVGTRLQMLRAEMSEKVAHYKSAAPMLVIGGLFLTVAFLVFTGAIIAAIAWAFAPQPYAYALSFAIVAVLYAIVGGVCLGFGVRAIQQAGIAPERTLRVLKQDQVWLQTEAKTQL